MRPAAQNGRVLERAVSTIDILGLNREHLKALRFQTWRSVNALCLALSSAQLPPAVQTEVEQSIQAALAAGAAFSAMTRHLVRHVHGLQL